MKKWYVFFICWVTWSWKWTLINGLLKENIWNLEFALSCKTREPRSGEIPGKDYVKLSFEEFKKEIEDWEFLEYNFVHNQDYYWTRKKDVIDNWIEKWKNLLKEIDMLIVPHLLENMKSLRKYFSIIYLDLPINTIRERMLSRGDSVDNKDYENRIESAQKEKNMKHLADFVVDATNSQEEILREVKEFILSKI